MAFLASLFQTIVKMLMIGLAAFGGIQLGKYLRKKKDEKGEK